MVLREVCIHLLPMLLPFQPAVVTRIEQVTSYTRRFFLSFSETREFQFVPGQFVTLDLPVHEKRNKRWRSYSIASVPNNGPEIELLIVQLEGGAGTRYLFEEVRVGTELQVRGPQGVFVLPTPVMVPTFFICTGTGIAPFRSMLHSLRNSGHTGTPLHLIFGTRSPEHLLYAEEMEALAAGWPAFSYYRIFSQPPPESGLRTGYVHQVYETLLAEKPLPEAQFYLCGWKNMIDEARTRLQALGYSKEQVHFEVYG